jgi:serine phosphatase RsbU (regulator of sigma subunit)/anti-sigma regulatory factor (Ser/Thr protein kinase)
MSTRSISLRRLWRRRPREDAPDSRAADDLTRGAEVIPVDISPNDPILAYFQSAGGAVDIENLQLASPALEELRAAGVKLVVPLISHGELIGVLNLGPRLSEQEYSADDRKLLDSLAGQAAPAVRVAQLLRQQESQARERERVEQELRVAQLIQQQYLPHDLPKLSGWHVSAFYRPAREVGGDFYDFIELPGNKVGIVVGDVTDKGVPAALVMATTHSLLRAEAPRLVEPAKVLERINELLVPDMPPKMFVTCLYAVLDYETGKLQFANAGHNVPYVSTESGVVELRARGMPLGLLEGMSYEEKETVLEPGQNVLLHSDGLAEAHDPTGDMFGFPRLQEAMAAGASYERLIDELLTELDQFTGADWEQEDDITLVTLHRAPSAASAFSSSGTDEPNAKRLLVEFEIPSEPGNERLVMDRVAEFASVLDLPGPRMERLKTAVSEAAMNAIEHGNKGRAELPVSVRLESSDTVLSVQIKDQGGNSEIATSELPDLEAKLAGLQSPRGWGLFLIKNMVDEMNVSSDGSHHTIELILHLKGGRDAHDSN